MATGEGADCVSYELHRLLGVPDDVGVDRLRRVYEEQMSAAARSHDHSRALALSSALDDLPQGLRSALYPRLTTRTMFPPPAVTTRSPVGRLTRSRAPRPSGRSPTSNSSRGAARVLLTLVGVSAIVLGIAYWQQHRLSSVGAGPAHFAGRGRLSPSTRPSPADDSRRGARLDAHRTVETIRRCSDQGGALPASTPPASGQAVFVCGAKAFTTPLAAGDIVSCVRTGRRTYRVIVTTANGWSVSYDSRTDHFSS